MQLRANACSWRAAGCLGARALLCALATQQVLQRAEALKRLLRGRWHFMRPSS